GVKTDNGTAPKYRPFGLYAYEIQNANDEDVKKKVEQCTATMSVLDRLSMLISSYIIIVGVLALISKTIGAVDCRDWPYIPTLLSWTILAIWRDAYSGIIVIKDHDKIFEEGQIRINENPKSRAHKRFTVVITAFKSIFYPWITLFLAYFTPQSDIIVAVNLSQYSAPYCHLMMIDELQEKYPHPEATLQMADKANECYFIPKDLSNLFTAQEQDICEAVFEQLAESNIAIPSVSHIFIKDEVLKRSKIELEKKIRTIIAQDPLTYFHELANNNRIFCKEGVSLRLEGESDSLDSAEFLSKQYFDETAYIKDLRI
ncbi:22738_t:CDS:2, partial [Gigaspora margarita]